MKRLPFRPLELSTHRRQLTTPLMAPFKVMPVVFPCLDLPLIAMQPTRVWSTTCLDVRQSHVCEADLSFFRSAILVPRRIPTTLLPLLQTNGIHPVPEIFVPRKMG